MPGTHRGPIRIIHYGSPQYANGILQSATDETVWEYARPQSRFKTFHPSSFLNPESTRSPNKINLNANAAFAPASFDIFSDVNTVSTGADHGQEQVVDRTFQPGYAETLADNSSIREARAQG